MAMAYMDLFTSPSALRIAEATLANKNTIMNRNTTLP